jgi:hypothetical protein
MVREMLADASGKIVDAGLANPFGSAHMAALHLELYLWS